MSREPYTELNPIHYCIVAVAVARDRTRQEMRSAAERNDSPALIAAEPVREAQLNEFWL